MNCPRCGCDELIPVEFYLWGEPYRVICEDCNALVIITEISEDYLADLEAEVEELEDNG